MAKREMKSWNVWRLENGEWVEDQDNPHKAVNRRNVLYKFYAKDGQTRNGRVKVRLANA